MKALVVTGFGGPEVLEWQDVVEPTPAPGEVLVRVRAVAVDWADLIKREQRYPGGPTPPFVSGHNLVGEVVAHGDGVGEPDVGTRVYGAVPTHGVAAELVAVPVAWVHVAPDRLRDEEAAGLAGSYFTADLALVTYGRLSPGEVVVVHAAAGGFGSAAVQLARSYGARIIVGTAGGPDKVRRVLELGADHAVDYLVDDFVPVVHEATNDRGADLVVESVGGDVLGRSFDCLRRVGRLVSVGASSGRSSDRFRLHTLFETCVSVAGFSFGQLLMNEPAVTQQAAARVSDAVGRGDVHPVVARVFPADQAQEAHRFLADRRSIGRTVISLTD